jgi:hypothetical protein
MPKVRLSALNAKIWLVKKNCNFLSRPSRNQTGELKMDGSLIKSPLPPFVKGGLGGISAARREKRNFFAILRTN